MGLFKGIHNYFKDKNKGRAYNYVIQSFYQISIEIDNPNKNKKELNLEFIKIARIVNYLSLKAKVSNREDLLLYTNILLGDAVIKIKYQALRNLIPLFEKNSLLYRDIIFELSQKLF